MATAKSDSKITTLDDAPDAALETAQEPVSAVAVKSSSTDTDLSGKRKTVTIYEQEGEAGRDDVFVGVNGVGYQIKRGKAVSIPVEVLHALDNAVQTIYDTLPSGQVIERSLKRFNYTVHA